MRQRWYRSKHLTLSLPHTHTHTHNCWSNIAQETLWSRRNERANPFSPLRSLSLSCSLSLSKTILYLSLSVVLSSSFLVDNIFPPLSLSFCLSLPLLPARTQLRGEKESEREWGKESATELNIHTSVCIYVLRGDWSAWFAERLGLINPPFKPNEPSSASFHLHSASVCLCTFLHVSTFISIKRWKFSSSCLSSEVQNSTCYWICYMLDDVIKPFCLLQQFYIGWFVHCKIMGNLKFHFVSLKWNTYSSADLQLQFKGIYTNIVLNVYDQLQSIIIRLKN